MPAIRVVERRWRARSGPMTLDERSAFEDRLSMLRRLILAADVAILATVGYWIGKIVAVPNTQIGGHERMT